MGENNRNQAVEPDLNHCMYGCSWKTDKQDKYFPGIEAW